MTSSNQTNVYRLYQIALILNIYLAPLFYDASFIFPKKQKLPMASAMRYLGAMLRLTCCWVSIWTVFNSIKKDIDSTIIRISSFQRAFVSKALEGPSFLWVFLCSFLTSWLAKSSGQYFVPLYLARMNSIISFAEEIF